MKILREKSKNNQLFCPCGCGSNLILVAGDQMIREQHFRLKNGEYNSECKAVTEGEQSVNSKIVLKCWLDDKLNDYDIESRVPIRAVDDIDRKYEFTFLSKKRSIAISYCYERANLSEEKFDVLEENNKNIKVIYVVGYLSIDFGGQYPEHLMKVQARQGYCLQLFAENTDYYKAKLNAILYLQDLDGFWREVVFAENLLCEYDIDDLGNVLYDGTRLGDLAETAKNLFYARLESERLRGKQELKRREEERKRLLEEEEKQRREYQKQQEEREKIKQRQREETEKKKQIEKEQRQEEVKQKEEFNKQVYELDFAQQDTPIRDADGKRLVQCKYCGKKARESEFDSYGGRGTVNLGTCYECSKNNLKANIIIKTKTSEECKKYDSNRCPECGKGQLREKMGLYGRFIGCSNYPKCKYTRKIEKETSKPQQ